MPQRGVRATHGRAARRQFTSRTRDHKFRANAAHRCARAGGDMSRRIAMTLISLASLAALVFPPAAQAATPSLTVEGFAGWQNLRLTRDSLGNAIGGREGTAIVGGD